MSKLNDSKTEKRKYQIKSMLRTIKLLREDDLISYNKVFSLFDKRGKGFISSSEILSTLKKVFQIPSISKEDEEYVLNLLTFLDLGCKGCINLEEFITYLESGKVPLNGTLRRSLRGTIPKNHPEYDKFIKLSSSSSSLSSSLYNNNNINDSKRRSSVVHNQTILRKKILSKPKLPEREAGKQNFEENYNILKDFQKKSSPSKTKSKTKSPTTQPLSISTPKKQELQISDEVGIAFSPSNFNNIPGKNNFKNDDENDESKDDENNNNDNNNDGSFFKDSNPIVLKELREAFDFLDIHNHGVISSHDFCVIMSRFGLIRRPTSNKNIKKYIVEAIQQEEKAMGKLFESVDSDGDGRITFEEFVKLLHYCSGL